MITEKEVIYVKWVDTIGDPIGGWKDDVDTDDFFDCDDNVVEEVGFVWSEDDDFINLCDSIMPGEPSYTRHRTKIPKKWILERIKLLGPVDEPEKMDEW